MKKSFVLFLSLNLFMPRICQATAPAYKSILGAINKNDFAAVEDFIDKQGVAVDVQDKQWWTPLHHAAGKGLKAMAEFLLSKGADCNKQDKGGRTPLHYALYYNNTAIAKLLINQPNIDVTIESGGIVALDDARDEEMWQLLLDKMTNTDVNKQDGAGKTLLHRAASLGKTGLIPLLLQKGALINQQDRTGNTPLHCAAQEGYLESVKALLKAGAQVDIKNIAKRTPLHLAAISSKPNNDKIIFFLKTKGADVNVLDNSGESPLSDASTGGAIKVLRSLNAKMPNEIKIEKSQQAEEKTSLLDSLKTSLEVLKTKLAALAVDLQDLATK
ncbi:ankyrin repeat domain-containing protein [Candidatus Babeliales bacterium]|nr:ankyrin repeat domain-containing protein [Candidatus Babeliales bacterium]